MNCTECKKQDLTPTSSDDSLSDMDVLLLVIYLIEHNNNKAGADYEAIKKLFISFGRKERPNFPVSIHNAKKQDFIEDKNKTIFFLIKGLKKIRKLLGQLEKSPVHIIKSGQNFTAIKLFEEFLMGEMQGNEILLCDSYISPVTLHPFSILNGRVQSLKILTANIFESDKLKDYQRSFKKETEINVEIKINKKIHERFLICGKKCWSIGSSIKDLGNKDAIIKEVTEVLESLRELFVERFNGS